MLSIGLDSMPKSISTCDLDLLIHASQAVYRITSNKTFLDDKESTPLYTHDHFLDTNKTIAAKHYHIHASISPEETKEGHACAVCLKPDEADTISPIVIAYRGTITKKDMGSNLSIALQGVAGKKLRTEAYDFYQKIKKEFPNREIVLTGHSLGGHLAQYVGVKAYVDKHDGVMVRTFNSAPITINKTIDTSHIEDQTINYRFADDFLTKLPLLRCYGDSYVFKIKRSDQLKHKLNPIQNLDRAHRLGIFYAALPDEIKNLQVGNSSHLTYEEATIIEKMKGMECADACCLEGRWLPRFGMKNNKLSMFNMHSVSVETLFNTKKNKQISPDLSAVNISAVNQRQTFRKTLLSILGDGVGTLKELSPYAVYVEDRKRLENLADKIEVLYIHLTNQDFHESGVLSERKSKRLWHELAAIRLDISKLKQEIVFEGQGGTPKEKTCLSNILNYVIYMIRGALDLCTQLFTLLFTGKAVSDKNIVAEKICNRSFFFQTQPTENEEKLIEAKLGDLLSIAEQISINLDEIENYDNETHHFP